MFGIFYYLYKFISNIFNGKFYAEFLCYFLGMVLTTFFAWKYSNEAHSLNLNALLHHKLSRQRTIQPTW